VPLSKESHWWFSVTVRWRSELGLQFPNWTSASPASFISNCCFNYLHQRVKGTLVVVVFVVVVVVVVIIIIIIVQVKAVMLFYRWRHYDKITMRVHRV